MSRMRGDYTNSILIVAFTFASNCNNIERLRRFYAPYFKRIIFYSDIPYDSAIKTFSEVHYLDIRNGWVVYRIFEHCREHYADELAACDGIFYTMDDNIINVNILNFYSTDKIIYECALSAPDYNLHDGLKPVEEHSGWHWSEENKTKVRNALKDPEFQQFGFNTVRGQFADYFYLPKRYLTPALFKLFTIFARHDVILEMAIPSILSFIEPDLSQYHTHRSHVLWSKEERAKLNEKPYLLNVFKKQAHLTVHPIKFNLNPHVGSWLDELFAPPKRKCVVITTINAGTEAIQKHTANSDYDTIIVGDKKTPAHYSPTEGIFLSVDVQRILFPELADLIPYNHYGRKNLGYLYAIARGYDVIYETDDDNIPLEHFDSALEPLRVETIKEERSAWINIFRYFSNDTHVWPRGYPISLIRTSPEFTLRESGSIQPSVITGLAENDPDVDAIFRLTCNHEVTWKKDKRVLISNENVCPFNSQNTFWVDPTLFVSMLIPSSVSFRYCDVLRGIIVNILMRKLGKTLMYTSANVRQERNDHDIAEDFKSEYEMYVWNETILEFIDADVREEMGVNETLRTIYNNLLSKGVIKELDLRILTQWMRYFDS